MTRSWTGSPHRPAACRTPQPTMNTVCFARSFRAFLLPRIALLVLLVPAAGFLSCPPAWAAVSDVGVIAGQISNKATGAFLEGARIEVKGRERLETAAGSE